MTDQEAHAESLRRIEEARRTSAEVLDLGDLRLAELPEELGDLRELRFLALGMFSVTDQGDIVTWQAPPGRGQRCSDLSALSGLTVLQTLDLSFCQGVSDLSPLSGLTALRALGLCGCGSVSDLPGLRGLPALQSLDLSYCSGIRDLSPLRGLTALQSLNLSYCSGIRDLSPLRGLTALQSLNLSYCSGIRDLSPLRGLTALQSLNLEGCAGVSDLSALRGLTALESLYLEGCVNLRCFLPLRPLLEHLTDLRLYRCAFDDLPVALCGSSSRENVLSKVRAHFADLDRGASDDAERKLFILGNGGVGKTQTRRRLRGQDFDPTIPSTHGVEIDEFSLPVEGRSSPVTLRIWDFGGQDIYHGTHALFLQRDALFLILWTSESEAGEWTDDNGIRLRNRPLVYWLDYVRGLVGTRSPVLVVRNKCDGPRVSPYDQDLPEDFDFLRSIEFSASKGRMGGLRDLLAEALEHLLGTHPVQQIGVGRAAVRQRLRDMLAADRERPPAEKQHRTLSREQFLALCAEEGNVTDPDALLDFLHLTGVVYHRPGQFGGRIILDQSWALDAIYTVLHRTKTLPRLKLDGLFTRQDLAGMTWQEHSEADQRVLLDMMESCGICFPLRDLSDDRDKPEWLYAAPDLLPEWDEARSRLLVGRLRGTPPDAVARVRYAFLHEGILRTFLSKVGGQAKDAGVYWKYGCWFGEETTQSTILVRSSQAADGAPWSGEVTLEAWGDKAGELVERVLMMLVDIPLGHPPQVERTTTPPAHRLEEMRHEERPAPLIGAEYAVGLRGESKQVFVSYAWGEDTAEGRRHEQDVERLCGLVKGWGYEPIQDKKFMKQGDRISEFMKLAGRTPKVLLILNAKYLRSVFCMKELHAVYRGCCRFGNEFRRRIVPLALPGARFHTIEERDQHRRFWQQQFEQLADSVDPYSRPSKDLALLRQLKTWPTLVPKMLEIIAGTLHPFGFNDDAEKIRARLA